MNRDDVHHDPAAHTPRHGEANDSGDAAGSGDAAETGDERGAFDTELNPRVGAPPAPGGPVPHPSSFPYPPSYPYPYPYPYPEPVPMTGPWDPSPAPVRPPAATETGGVPPRSGNPEPPDERDHHRGGPPRDAPPPAGTVAATDQHLGELQEALTGRLTALQERVAELDTRVAESVRLGQRDRDHIDKLHAENQTLREGEHAKRIRPLIDALLGVHDTASSLAAGDDASAAGIIRAKLLQVLDIAAGVSAFTPEPAEAFDSRVHNGKGRVPATSADRHNTVSRTLKPGFRGPGGVVLRPADVEVARFEETR